jgi:hypothetical protein
VRPSEAGGEPGAATQAARQPQLARKAFGVVRHRKEEGRMASGNGDCVKAGGVRVGGRRSVMVGSGKRFQGEKVQR